MKSRMIFLLAASLLIASCAKDKTLEQWQREKQAEDVAKIQSVSGIYSGSLGDSSSKFTLELKPGTLIIASNGTATQQQATVQGRVTVIGEDVATASFDQGFLDRDTNELHIEIKIKDSADITNTLDISGIVGNGQFNGEIVNRNYPETVRKLNLSTADRDGLNNEIRNKNATMNHTQSKAYVYEGTVVDMKTRTDLKAELNIILPVRTTEELFLQTFSPVNIVHASFILKKSENIKEAASFRAAQWNRTTGTLNAREVLQSGLDIRDRILNCRFQVEMNGWHCTYILGNEGVSFEGDFK